MSVLLKVCCIQSTKDAWIAIRHGARFLGFVSDMPNGPGVITDEEIATLTSQMPPGVVTVLLSSLQDAESIISQHSVAKTNALQLVDRVPVEELKKLRAALPGISLIQVVHVTGIAALDEAMNVEPHVDAILLDSGNPDADEPTLGGTGETHDWTISRRITETISKPVFLAGGLNHDNVGEAVINIRPYAVDLCSSLRTDDKLDNSKLEVFSSHLLAAVLRFGQVDEV